MKRTPALLAAIALLAALAGACSTGGGGDNADWDGTGDVPDDGCVPLVVATSSEKVNLMDEVGEAFKESDQAQGLDSCVTVYPINVSSGKAAEILSGRPDQWPEGDESIWPVVWSPASTVWTDRVASLAGDGYVKNVESFTHTPVVFGMPESMARVLGWPDAEIGIHDFEKLIADGGWPSVGKPLWGSFKVAKTNPNTSTTGLSTILMQTYAAQGKTEGLTPDDVAAAKDFSQSFEAAAIHYGDTTGKVLANLAESSTGAGSSYVSAVALEETSLFNYNLGNPDSHTVQPGEQLTPPDEKLVAVYPSEGSLWSDNPAALIDAKWVTGEQKAAGAAFLDFLQSKTVQQIVPKYGFRPLDQSVDAGSQLNAGVGIDLDQPAVTLEKPAPAVVTAALDQWTQIRKPSAVLELIDISGSMDEDAGNGSTRLELAVDAARATVDTFRPTDDIGVWAFTTGLTSQIDGAEVQNIAPVRDFGPLGSDKETLRNSISDLLYSSRKGTPLYDAVGFAYEYLAARAEPGRINAIVVLSDGEDTDSANSIEALIQRINQDTQEGGSEAPVRVFAIAYGGEADLDSLQMLARASGGQVFDASDATKVADVLRSVMNNF
ncbi:MAG: substrate-binding and VWA domain-containing protein [Bifidobacteriaceae bacterium]|jgi:Ca-activated chloride channel family protein|nr:substrate-binding and VWA domain-containing protein [Bifidobacteriaceae bacterium]